MFFPATPADRIFAVAFPLRPLPTQQHPHSMDRISSHPPTGSCTYPHSGLGQIGPHGYLLAGRHVRVPVPAERVLQTCSCCDVKCVRCLRWRLFFLSFLGSSAAPPPPPAIESPLSWPGVTTSVLIDASFSDRLLPAGWWLWWLV